MVAVRVDVALGVVVLVTVDVRVEVDWGVNVVVEVAVGVVVPLLFCEMKTSAKILSSKIEITITRKIISFLRCRFILIFQGKSVSDSCLYTSGFSNNAGCDLKASDG